MRLYLREVGQHPLLSKDQEADLARVIETGVEARRRLERHEPDVSAAEHRTLQRQIQGGEHAATTFVEANLRLVVSIAKRYQSSGLPLLDLIQEGNLGLMHAVEKFDWRRGFKFSTYATWWIRQAITRGIANSSRTVRLPVHVGDLALGARRVANQLHQQLGRKATRPEIAAELGVTEHRLVEALRFADPLRSLSEPLSVDGDAEMGDKIADYSAASPFDVAAVALMRDDLDALLGSHLDDRERRILRLRFGLDHGEPRTLEEVGREFQLTRERIRQIEAKALTKLRHPSVAYHAVAELLDS